MESIAQIQNLRIIFTPFFPSLHIDKSCWLYHSLPQKSLLSVHFYLPAVSLIPTTILSHPDCCRNFLARLANSTLAPYNPFSSKQQDSPFKDVLHFSKSLKPSLFKHNLPIKEKSYHLDCDMILPYYISCKFIFYVRHVKI